MKKFFIVLFVASILALPNYALALVGTCTQTSDEVASSTSPAGLMRSITFVCTASADNGSFPSTATSTANTALIKGLRLRAVVVYNGTTAPTPLYSVAINGALGVDVLGGAGYSITGVASTGVQLVPWGYMSKRPVERPIDGVLTLVITGSTVNSALVTVKAYFTID
jgi:hypothetical protein